VRCRWLDDEGDLVTLKSVEGMEEALRVCGCKLRLHVSVRRTSPVSIQACHAATWSIGGAGDTHEMRVCQAPRTCGRTFRVCAASSYLCREPTSDPNDSPFWTPSLADDAGGRVGGAAGSAAVERARCGTLAVGDVFAGTQRGARQWQPEQWQ
jgi:hypothetical protein